MLKPMAKHFGRKVLERELSEQARLGYKLTLTGSPKNWIDGFMIADMTNTWHAAGLQCQGLNYFTMGDIKDGLSTRFQPDNSLYQAWLGGYIVEHEEPAWSTEEYVSLSKFDQIKWLRHFGDKSPKMDFGKANKLGPISNGTIKGNLYYWHGDTHSDVGKRSVRLYTRGLMEGMAAIINMINPKLSVEGHGFVPRLTKQQQSYEPVTLHGFHAIYTLGPSRSIVLYSTATEKVDQKYLKSLFGSIRIDQI